LRSLHTSEEERKEEGKKKKKKKKKKERERGNGGVEYLSCRELYHSHSLLKGKKKGRKKGEIKRRRRKKTVFAMPNILYTSQREKKKKR